jgi:hypothetical protein
VKVGAPKRKGMNALSPALYDQLLHFWSVQDDVFCRLLHKYLGRASNHQNLSFVDFFALPDVRRRLSQKQRLVSRPHNKISELRSFELDGFFFASYTEELKTDNSCVMCEFVEDQSGQRSVAYGRIRFIFKHTLYTKEVVTVRGNKRSKTVVENFAIILDCDWYSVVEDTPVDALTKLTRIQRNFNFESCRLALASHVLPIHVAFWPEDPFSDDCDVFIVIHQRDRDPEQFVH